MLFGVRTAAVACGHGLANCEQQEGYHSVDLIGSLRTNAWIWCAGSVSQSGNKPWCSISAVIGSAWPAAPTWCLFRLLEFLFLQTVELVKLVPRLFKLQPSCRHLLILFCIVPNSVRRPTHTASIISSAIMASGSEKGDISYVHNDTGTGLHTAAERGQFATDK